MSRGKLVALIVIALLLIALALVGGIAIGRGGKNSGAGSPTASAASESAGPSQTPSSPRPHPSGSSTPSPSGAPASPVVFHAYNVRLPDSEGGIAAGFRLTFDSPAATVSVVLHGGVPTPNATVFVCPIKTLASSFSPSACDTPSSGETVQIAHGATYEGVEVILIGVGPGGKSYTTVQQISVKYAAVDRSMQIRLPPIAKQIGASACKDNGCNPFFELTPRRAGHFQATAQWPGKGAGYLSMETGQIAEHGLSMTGTPYHVVDFMEGGGPVKVSGRLDATTEAALALRNNGTKYLNFPVIAVTWP